MILADNLTSSGVILNSGAKTRWEIIKEMVALASQNSLIPEESSAEIQQSIVAREKSMSTGIGKGVAIPHCTIPGIKSLVVLLATSQKGINFDAIDNAPVKIIIMLLVPKEKLEQHIKTLANIAKLMSKDSFKESILSFTEIGDLLSFIKNYES